MNFEELEAILVRIGPSAEFAGLTERTRCLRCCAAVVSVGLSVQRFEHRCHRFVPERIIDPAIFRQPLDSANCGGKPCPAVRSWTPTSGDRSDHGRSVVRRELLERCSAFGPRTISDEDDHCNSKREYVPDRRQAKMLRSVRFVHKAERQALAKGERRSILNVGQESILHHDAPIDYPQVSPRRACQLLGKVPSVVRNLGPRRAFLGGRRDLLAREIGRVRTRGETIPDASDPADGLAHLDNLPSKINSFAALGSVRLAHWRPFGITRIVVLRSAATSLPDDALSGQNDARFLPSSINSETR